METIERLYIPNPDKKTAWLTKTSRNQVEYIRTDAFIEKACDWLRTHSEMDFFELIPVGNYCGAGNLNKKKMIEDFRNYMKGE